MRNRSRTSLASKVGGVLAGAAAVVAPYFMNDARGTLFQYDLGVPTASANPNLVGTYTINNEDRDDLPGVSLGLDSYDVGLNTSAMPNDKFFVTYFDVGGTKVENGFTPVFHVNDTLTAYGSFENRVGGSTIVENTIRFTNLDLSNNTNGVTNLSFYASIDSDFNGIFDTFRSGNVSDYIGQEVEPWTQLILSGQTWQNGFDYMKIDFTATGTASVPESSSALFVGAAGLLSAGALSQIRKRRRNI